MWREMQEQMRQGDGKGAAGGSMDSLTPEEMAQMLYPGADERRPGADAGPGPPGRAALRRHGAGRPVGGTYYLYRTLRNLDLDAMLEKLMEASREQVGGELTALEERLEHDEYNERIEQFKKEIEAEIRRRLVADRGVEAMAKTLRKPLPEDVEFMHASRDEMLALRKALLPADPQARRPPGPQAPSRPQGPARLPQHRAALAVATAACPPSRSSSTRALPSPS